MGIEGGHAERHDYDDRYNAKIHFESPFDFLSLHNKEP
jgi:hypothetical protein